ncbi:SRPBCC family protein [Flavivirga jejuensis]|uniref:SRPBCC family protein n=1 Tax=Flavivirga jejuensis TaxID=870487 RepID=A0ABT8WIM9_9FLAO|nr:SRPBCC family protein [Flavivirga jejuensis]MDO5972978.1 SRPBCC family protein [Flavivirga jejuensis]
MKQLLMIPVILLMISCNGQNKVKMSEKQTTKTEKKAILTYPKASSFVNSPLRNRMVLELNQPTSEVYNLVGDPANMPKFSAGLEKVETETKNEKCTSYTCYFKPIEEGEKGIIHTEKVVWQETDLGWASSKKEATEFGFTENFSLTTLEAKGDKTILTWDMHFNHENQEMLEMNKTTLVDVFDDMAEQLIAKFDGKIIENYIE